MSDDPETVRRFARWLDSLRTATYGFRERAQQRRLRQAAKLLLRYATRLERDR